MRNQLIDLHAGQIHPDVDGYTVRSVRVARSRTALPLQLFAGIGEGHRHVGSDHMRVVLLPLPRLLLHVHILRGETSVLHVLTA